MSDQAEDPEVAEALKTQKIAEANKAALEAERAGRLADPSTEEGKLEEHKRLAEARKAIADAEKGAFDAAFPRGTTQPLEGKIETDGASGYIAELVGYRAMDKCATAIAEAINKAQLGSGKSDAKPKILIVDSANVAQGDMPLEQIRRQMDLIETELAIQDARLKSLLLPGGRPSKPARGLAGEETGAEGAMAVPLPLAIGAVTSVVSQFADLLSYFRTDYSVKGRTFTISDMALTASIAGKIKDAYVLNFYRLSPASSPDSVMKRFEGRLARRQEVDRTANEVIAKVICPGSSAVASSKAKVRQLQARLDSAKEADKPDACEKLDAEQQTLAGLVSDLEAKQGVIAAWVTASAAIDARLGVMLISGDGGTAPLLLQAAAREQTKDMTHLLYVKVSSSGGESVTRRSLWPFFRPEISYLGGGAVTYLLSTAEGQIVVSDTVTALGRIKYDLSEPKRTRGG